MSSSPLPSGRPRSERTRSKFWRGRPPAPPAPSSPRRPRRPAPRAARGPRGACRCDPRPAGRGAAPARSRGPERRARASPGRARQAPRAPGERWRRVPCPPLCAVSEADCASASAREIERPRPSPRVRGPACSKGSKMRPSRTGSMPAPVSCTSTATRFASSGTVRRRIRPPGRRELDRVLDDVPQDLPQPRRVRVHADVGERAVPLDQNALGGGLALTDLDRRSRALRSGGPAPARRGASPARSASGPAGRRSAGPRARRCGGRPPSASAPPAGSDGFFSSTEDSARTGVSGVRSSWESVARNRSFAWLAASRFFARAPALRDRGPQHQERRRRDGHEGLQVEEAQLDRAAGERAVPAGRAPDRRSPPR